MIVAQGIRTDGLHGRPRLDGVSFEVGPGSVFALLGNRGAGKDTLIGVLRGTVRPSGGTLTVAGLDSSQHGKAARKRLAIASGATGLYGDLSPMRSLLLLARLAGVTPGKADVAHALRRAGLPDRLIHAPARHLESGHRLSVGIALALVRRVEAIVLEEPTETGDLKQALTVREIVEELRLRNLAVLMITSDVSLATSADRVGVLRSGCLATECSPSELLAWSLPELLLELGGHPSAGSRAPADRQVGR